MWAHYPRPLRNNHQGPESWSPFAASFWQKLQTHIQFPCSSGHLCIWHCQTMWRKTASFPGTRPLHEASPVSCKCFQGLHNIYAFFGFQNRWICASDGHLLGPAVYRDASPALRQQPVEAAHHWEALGMRLDPRQLQHHFLPRVWCLKRCFDIKILVYSCFITSLTICVNTPYFTQWVKNNFILVFKLYMY